MEDRRAALVTGGTRGLGAAMTRALHALGFRVAAVYHSNSGAASELVGELGQDAIAIKADVADMADCERAVSRTLAAFGRLDVLVNNAGITRDALLPRASEADFDRVVAVNLTGAMNMIRAACGPMADTGGGHVVNVSSRSGRHGKAGQAAYSASKAALLGLTYCAAAELGPRGIRVNAILPGYMDTDMGRRAADAMSAAKAASALGTLSSPVEAAALVAWLVATRTVTGQVFALDSRVGLPFEREDNG